MSSAISSRSRQTTSASVPGGDAQKPERTPSRIVGAVRELRRQLTRTDTVTQIRFGLVRHGERADSIFDNDEDWTQSPDARSYPLDPPLTAQGHEQARVTGETLRQAGEWQVVVSSPFLRCIDTAIEICGVTGAELLIDEEFREFETEEVSQEFSDEPGSRPYGFLVEHCRKRGVAVRNPDAPCGAVDEAHDDRSRFARRFFVYLERARLLHTNFVVVTHGSAFPVVCDMLPQFRDQEVKSVPYCALVLGSLRLTADEQERDDAVIDEASGTSETVEVLSLLKRVAVTYSNIDGSSPVTGRRGSFLARLSRPFFTRRGSLRVRSRDKVADILGLALQLELEQDEEGVRSSHRQQTDLAAMKISRSTLKLAGCDLELIEAGPDGKLTVKLVNPEPTGLMSPHQQRPAGPKTPEILTARTPPLRGPTAAEGPAGVKQRSVDLDQIDNCESKLLKRRMDKRMSTDPDEPSTDPDELNLRL
jgi:broad specificity phosphatase PhoE